MTEKSYSPYYKLNEDKSTSPCSLEEWSDQYSLMNIHVAHSKINRKIISTVWLGVNHAFHVCEPPEIFETIVFSDKNQDIYCDRYSTWQEAEEGHKKATLWVIDGAADDE